MEQTENYFESAKSKLLELTNNADGVDVVSFNYTLSNIDIKDMNLNLKSWTNIHGNARYRAQGSDLKQLNLFRPLLSIDGYYDDYDQMVSDNRLSFTKEHRLAQENHSYDNLQSFGNIDIFKSYGFSFGRSDWTAIKEIFNRIQLTETNVILECYFHVQDRRNEEDERNAFEFNLSKLLNRYGEKFNVENLYLKLKQKGRVRLVRD